MKRVHPGIHVCVVLAGLLLSSCNRFGLEITHRKYRPGYHINWSSPIKHREVRLEKEVISKPVMLQKKKEASALTLESKQIDLERKIHSSVINRPDVNGIKEQNRIDLRWASATNHITDEMFIEEGKKITEARQIFEAQRNLDDFAKPTAKKRLSDKQVVGIVLVSSLYICSVFILGTVASSIYVADGFLFASMGSAGLAVVTGVLGISVVTILFIITIRAIVKKNENPSRNDVLEEAGK